MSDWFAVVNTVGALTGLAVRFPRAAGGENVVLLLPTSLVAVTPKVYTVLLTSPRDADSTIRQQATVACSVALDETAAPAAVAPEGVPVAVAVYTSNITKPARCEIA